MQNWCIGLPLKEKRLLQCNFLYVLRDTYGILKGYLRDSVGTTSKLTLLQRVLQATARTMSLNQERINANFRCFVISTKEKSD